MSDKTTTLEAINRCGMIQTRNDTCLCRQQALSVVAALGPYKDQVIAWLQRREQKWRETAMDGLGAASEAASFYAAAYHNAWQGIANDEPQKRAKFEQDHG